MKSYEHIVIIDDDKTFVFVTFKMIQNITNCKNIQIKMSGQTTLQYLQECDRSSNFPDLITLDMGLPLGDGAEILKHYQTNYAQKYPSTKIIIISGKNQNDIKKESTKYTFVTGSLEKPIEEAKFKALI